MIRIPITILVLLVLSCSSHEPTFDALYHLNTEKLRQTIKNDAEAAQLYHSIKIDADKSLTENTSPLDTIYYEGLIEADPRRIRSRESLKDAVKSENLAWTYLVEQQEDYLRKAVEIILEWSGVYKPIGNPISEKELIPMIRAYALLRDRFSKEEQAQVDDWLKNLANSEIEKEDRSRSIYINNWQAKRLWIVGYVGFILKHNEYIEYVKKGYKIYADSAFYEDGRSFDFVHRDALHYHASGLWPLIDLCIAADRNNLDLVNYQSIKGGSLRKCIDFMIPYSTGEKEHLEFANSRVKFDRIRFEAGEEMYSGKNIYDGQRTAKVIEYYSYFDEGLMPIAIRIKNSNASRFTNWQTVINHVLSDH